MNESKIKGTLFGAVIGDAIGAPFEGLSRAHLHSIFRSIDNYTDATPALKGKFEQWKKPGLYASTSQLMILAAIFAVSNKRPDTHGFIRFINDTPEAAENEYGIFRHPASMQRHFMQTAKAARDSAKNKIYSSPCATAAVILVPFAVLSSADNEKLIMNLLSFSLMFNRDVCSAAGTLIFNLLLRSIINEKRSENILSLAQDVISSLLKKIEMPAPGIFELGINPDYLLSSIMDYSRVLSGIKNAKDIDEAEKIIFTYVNAKIKTPITRATVNHPLAIIPFSIYFAGFYSDRPSETLFRAAEMGGASSVLCAMTGALNGAALGCDWMPENLPAGLINKKRILNIVESVSKGKMPDELVHDFLQCEASLTTKEIQEKNAKLKHVKVKIKKRKPRHEIERELSAHVVESWTKLDKAKWRKKLDKEKG